MRHVLVVVLLGAVSLPVEAGAQIKAYSVAMSGDRVVLEVQVPDETPATIQVRNGETARVGRTAAAPIGLTPVIRGDGMDLIVVQVLIDARTGNEGIRHLARYSLTRGLPTLVADGDPVVEVTWLRTEPPAASGAAPMNPCTTCCIICDNYLYCGCVVMTECGSCCCPSACLCPFEPQQPGGRPIGGVMGGACRPSLPSPSEVTSGPAGPRQRTVRLPAA